LFFFVNFALRKREPKIRSRLAINGEAETDEQFQSPALEGRLMQVEWAVEETAQEFVKHGS
jgi:hypothetical protein